MLKICQWLGTLAGFGLLVSIGGTILSLTAQPTLSATNPGIPHAEPSRREFEPIEQPLGVKLGVTATGLSLVGLELWWFLFSKPKSQSTRRRTGAQAEHPATVTLQSVPANPERKLIDL